MGINRVRVTALPDRKSSDESRMALAQCYS